MDNNEYQKQFSDEGFWTKLKDFALAAGAEVIFLALRLYYAYQNPVTPLWAKTVIVLALGYFISPIDAIPDITPVTGYADDLGVLALAAAQVAVYIDDGVNAKSEEKMKHWFGDYKKKS